MLRTYGEGMTTDDTQHQPQATWASAQSLLADDHAVVLWKPDCEFSVQLLDELKGHLAITWVNVREDEDANARVRELNDGNELTPTVLVGEQVLRNPSADDLRAMLPD